MDRLKVRASAGLRISPAEGRRLCGVEAGGGFAASVRDLIPALIMCVAKAALSFRLNSSFPCPVPVDFEFAVRDSAVFFVLELVVGLSARETGREIAFVVSASANSSSLAVTTVAVVHDIVDAIAVLTASAFACNEAIDIMCVNP